MEHTPGKWYAKPKNGYYQVIEGGDPDCRCCTSDLMIAAEVTEKDARLIAAAPDLLEACKAMERISDLWLPTEASIEHRGEAIALHSARVKILNAIETAEGGNP